VSDEKALALAGTPAAVRTAGYFSDEQMALIKSQIAPKATDAELQLFLYQCARTGLDPLSKQIYAIWRRQKGDDGRYYEKMTIQTGIDGLRLIADRTGRYAPGPECDFDYNAEGKLTKARAHIRKQTKDGTWHLVSATVFWDEYTADNTMWNQKGHVMLGKCAEAACHRKAFPAETSGLVIGEEMERSGDVSYTPPPANDAQKAVAATTAKAPKRLTVQLEAPPAAEAPKAKAPTPASSASSTTTSQADSALSAVPTASSAVDAAKAVSPGAAEREPGDDGDVSATETTVPVWTWDDRRSEWLVGTPAIQRTNQQNKAMRGIAAELGMSDKERKAAIWHRYNKKSSEELSVDEMDDFLDALRERKNGSGRRAGSSR